MSVEMPFEIRTLESPTHVITTKVTLTMECQRNCVTDLRQIQTQENSHQLQIERNKNNHFKQWRNISVTQEIKNKVWMVGQKLKKIKIDGDIGFLKYSQADQGNSVLSLFVTFNHYTCEELFAVKLYGFVIKILEVISLPSLSFVKGLCDKT